MHEAIAKLQTLYEAHGPILLRYLRRMTGNTESAEDLLQETFVQALRREDRLGDAVSPQAWLFAIARNLAISSLRRRKPASRLPEDVPAVFREEDPRAEAMRAAILKLPAAQREALELRLRDELSYEEIAQALDIPVGTVRSRLHHAVKTLRETIRNE